MYWPNAIFFSDSDVSLFFAKLDADKMGSSTKKTYQGKYGTTSYDIYKEGEDVSLYPDAVNPETHTYVNKRQLLEALAGDIFCTDFNYIIRNPPFDNDSTLPANWGMMNDSQKQAWTIANAYFVLEYENGEKIKFRLMDADTLASPANVAQLSNKEWCGGSNGGGGGSGGGSGGGMVFFGIAIAAIIAIVLYSKLAAKKR
jgi:hypothetical protein